MLPTEKYIYTYIPIYNIEGKFGERPGGAFNMLVFFLVLILVVLAISYITYRMAFYVSPRQKGGGIPMPGSEQYAAVKHITKPLMEEMAALPYEQVCIRSHDGLQLAARYYHVRDGAPVQIQVHGYRGGPIRDFCGGNKLARSMGHNTLVIEQRALGRSEGRTITFGVKERLDCLAWANYAAQRWTNADVLLSGVSMGATTVLMAAGLELPGNVRGVIADCPFASPERIIAKVCRDMHIPPALALPFIRLGARVFGGFELREADAAQAVKDARVPVLILHGEEDRFVPCEMSAEIQRANPAMVQRHTFPGAGHGLSYVVDARRYEQLTREFAAACLER